MAKAVPIPWPRYTVFGLYGKGVPVPRPTTVGVPFLYGKMTVAAMLHRASRLELTNTKQSNQNRQFPSHTYDTPTANIHTTKQWVRGAVFLIFVHFLCSGIFLSISIQYRKKKAPFFATRRFQYVWKNQDAPTTKADMRTRQEPISRLDCIIRKSDG